MPGPNSNYQKWIDLGKGVSVFCGAFSGVMTIGALVIKEGVLIVGAVSGMIVTGCVAGGTCGLWCARRRRMQPATIVRNPVFHGGNRSIRVAVMNTTQGSSRNLGPCAVQPA